MTYRLRIRHESAFSYDTQAVSSFNEARMTPVSETGQSALDTRLDVRPATTVLRYLDYWGSQVHAFDIHRPHDRLRVTAVSVVETEERPSANEEAVGWSVVRGDEVGDRFVEWLDSTPRTAPTAEMRAKAAEIVDALRPREAAREICAYVHGAIEYVPGATGVHSDVGEVWAQRKGVCQDIAHVTIGMLRSAGIPARYVSGYFDPRREAEVGTAVAGESHAWVEWWDGGWSAYDPTNDLPIGVRHVVVARGREYGDVAPFKGLYSGSGSSRLEVTVELTRLA
jgi:transglutaminase-like putative cysteine protease